MTRRSRTSMTCQDDRHLHDSHPGTAIAIQGTMNNSTATILCVAALEYFGLSSVRRDPDTVGGWVGSVDDDQTAKRVAAEMRDAGLDVSIASASTDEPGDPVWVYVRVRGVQS